MSPRDAMQADGAVLVPAVLRHTDCVRAGLAIERCRASPSVHYGVLSPPGAPLVDSDLFRWRDVPELAEVAMHPALVELACSLLDTDAAVFVEDQWFASAAGAVTASPWHQDGPYYRLDRPFVTLWVALDDAPAALALRAVAGSHCGPIYAPVEFAASGATIGTGNRLPAVPDVGARAVHDSQRRELLTWDVRAGDVIALDSRSLHSAGDGEVGGGGFRRLSTRWAHPDTRYVDAGPQVATFWDVLDHRLAYGDLLMSDQFPVLRR
jgi:hypothetical protein